MPTAAPKTDSPAEPLEPLRLGVWVGGASHELDPLLARLPERYAVVRMGEGGSRKEIELGMRSVDVALFEWAMGPIVPASRIGVKVPTLVRMLRYEPYTAWPRAIAWYNVDDLIVPSESVRHALSTLYEGFVPGPTTRVHVIPGGIDVAAYPMDPAKSHTHDLAFAGPLHHVKNPALLVQLIGALVRHDPRYVLHVAGTTQHAEIEHYLRYHADRLNLSNHLKLHGALDPDELRMLLARCSYLVTTSLSEAHPVGVLVGMAMGLRPVIHDFYGADTLFPRGCIWNLIDEAVEQITSGEVEPEDYRRFVEEQCSLDTQVEALVNVMDRAVSAYQPERLARLIDAAPKRPDQIAQITFDEAHAHVQAERFEEAVASFASLDFSYLAEDLWLRARVMALHAALRVEASAEALRHANAAIKLAPDEPLVLNLVGRAQWMAGKKSAARTKLIRAAERSTATDTVLPFDAARLRRDAAEVYAAGMKGGNAQFAPAVLL